MSKYGKTKSDVLKLISENKDTLSIISSELGLAPSTVSKHLNELQDLGAIRLVKSEYAKKWKHYEFIHWRMSQMQHNLCANADARA